MRAQEFISEISDQQLQRYLDRAGSRVDSRLERMAQARDRLNKGYEIYHAEDPTRIVHRFEANTPAEAKRYYERYNANYDSDVDYDLRLRRATGLEENFADGNSMSTNDMAEGQHQHTEIIKWPVGDWIVYLDNHSVIRAMTRNIGPRMMSNLLNMVSTIPNLEDKVPKNGAFWIQDIKTNSSFYFRRLDIPGEPLAVRCETGVQDVPRANKNTPVFRVNAYTGPETPKDIQGMKQAKLRSKFVGTNVMASNLAANIQKGHLGSDDVIRNPATQDSKRYDRAFKQAQQMDKEVDENFADGKVKGKSRPGRVKRSGASCNGSVTDLRARAKRASGEKAKMYHWCANMKSGKQKNK